MDFIKRFFRKKPVKILFGILLVGTLLVAVPYIISPEQCPVDYTQQQVDTSDCIIGADIGSGMIWMLGVLIVAIAIIGLCLMLISTISSNVARVAVALLLIGTTLLIAGIATAPVRNSSEVYKHARCSADDRKNGELIISEYCEFPRKSPLAEIDYFNYKVVVSAVLLMSGILISGYYLLKRPSI